MSGQSKQVIEYIDGSIPIIRDDYHKETNQILRKLPKATEHPVLPSDETLVENMKNNYNDYEKVVEIGNRLIEQEKTPKQRKQRARKNSYISDEKRRIITDTFRNQRGKFNIKEQSKNFNVKPDTLRYLIRKLKKGESIERSKVRRGRHLKVTPEIAKKLDSMYENREVKSDGQASRELKRQGIDISRSTIERALTDGLMEKYGLCSLTLKHVSYRGKDAESEENKQLRQVQFAKLCSYRDQGYHPVFVDETHWNFGWVWSRQRGKKGEKVIAENAHRSYSITAIAAISELGPGYTLIIDSNSITATMFNDYMVRLLNQCPDRKQVFFMDNATVHRKDDIIPLVRSVKNKEIVFNAPYTPDCNAIENFFSIWKRKVEEKCSQAPTPKEMKKYIEDTFGTFKDFECMDLINNVFNKVQKLVIEKADL